MITAKFTKQELMLIRNGLKFLANKHPEVAQSVINDCIPFAEVSKRDAMIECARLVGNIDSLIRNFKYT